MSKLPKAVIDRLKDVAGEQYSEIILQVYNLGKEVGFRDAIDTLKRHVERNHSLGCEDYVEPTEP